MRRLLPRSLFTNLGVVESGSRLPHRVLEIIRRQEERSEQLIGWVQLALISTFGLLYLVSPKPTDTAMTAFQPVPVAIGLYLAFTLLRLALAYTRYLPGWLLVLSMIIDMVMLFGLIWSFHIQYEQPPAFYLKVPTFMYVFIFIAMRALRFDHRFVLSVGIFAALGWLAMLAYAFNDAGMDRVTRNFVEYLTGNYVLIGAEFDKIFAILVTTAILTFAAWRGRRMLVAAVREETARHEIRRFLSEGVDEAITESADVVEAGAAAERNAAILMVDIRGFTALSARLDPRTVVSMLTAFHAAILPVIAEHHGVVDKFLGDGVMATFGAVRPSTTAAADALTALDRLMVAADGWRTDLLARSPPIELDVNGAVAAGSIVFAALGSGARLEFTVIGEAANMAAKLEKHNKAERVRAITNAETFELAVAQGFSPLRAVEHRRGRRVAGAPVPVDIVVLCPADKAAGMPFDPGPAAVPARGQDPAGSA